MKKIIYLFTIVIMVFWITILSGCYSGSQTTSGNRYYVPDWAPAYEQGVRYYYIPDIETYYDVTNGNYVYLDRGRWIFARNLPQMYRGYNLHNGYQVIINRNVYEPWRYHQNYLTSYPRYYYRDVYSNRGNERIRGYNENAEKPVYVSAPNNSRRSSTYSSGRSGTTTRESRSSDYSNRRSGSVEKKSSDRQQSTQPTPSGTSSRRQSQSTGSGTGTGNESSGEVQQQRKSSTTAPPAVESNERRQQDSNNKEERRSSRRR